VDIRQSPDVRTCCKCSGLLANNFATIKNAKKSGCLGFYKLWSPCVILWYLGARRGHVITNVHPILVHLAYDVAIVTLR